MTVDFSSRPSVKRNSVVCVQATAHSLAPRRSRIVLMVASAAQFLIIMNTTALNVGLYSILTEFRLSTEEVRWIATTYTVVFAGSLLGGGRLSDRLGGFRSFFWGAAVYAIGMCLAATAARPATLIGALAIQGLGAALLTPALYAVLADAFPGSQAKAQAIGVWASIAGSAQAIGPIVGGVSVSNLGWRGIFLVSLVALLIVITSGISVAQSDPVNARRASEAGWCAHELISILLWIISPTCLFASLVCFGSASSSSLVVSLFAVGLVSATVLVWTETISAVPVLPTKSVLNRTFVLINGIGGCLNFTYYGSTFLMAFYMQSVDRMSAVSTALILVPIAAMMCLGPAMAARLCASYSPRIVLRIGLIICLAGLIGAALVTSAPWTIRVGMTMLATLGIGMTAPAMTSQLIIAVRAPHRGIAMSSFTTSRQFGGAFGVVAYGRLLIEPVSTQVTTVAFVLGIFVMTVALTAACLLPVTERALEGDAP